MNKPMRKFLASYVVSLRDTFDHCHGSMFVELTDGKRLDEALVRELEAKIVSLDRYRRVKDVNFVSFTALEDTP